MDLKTDRRSLFESGLATCSGFESHRKVYAPHHGPTKAEDQERYKPIRWSVAVLWTRMMEADFSAGHG